MIFASSTTSSTDLSGNWEASKHLVRAMEGCDGRTGAFISSSNLANSVPNQGRATGGPSGHTRSIERVQIKALGPIGTAPRNRNGRWQSPWLGVPSSRRGCVELETWRTGKLELGARPVHTKPIRETERALEHEVSSYMDPCRFFGSMRTMTLRRTVFEESSNETQLHCSATRPMRSHWTPLLTNGLADIALMTKWYGRACGTRVA